MDLVFLKNQPTFNLSEFQILNNLYSRVTNDQRMMQNVN